MALHVFSTQFHPENTDKSAVFLGTPYDLFCKWLPKGLMSLGNIGYDIADFGTHSFRKGIATYCSGFIAGPNVIAIFLRAGWSLGQVQDRYISWSGGGDHLCARVAAGLDINGGSRFAVLPPHFENDDPLSKEEWQLVFPAYNDYPIGFQACLPYFLASIVQHWEWLLEPSNISPYHPIFQSRLVTSGIIPRLKSKLCPINCTGRCPITQMTASGIPPHVELAQEMEIVKDTLSSLQKLVIERFDALPSQITTNILDNCEIEGVVPLTASSLSSTLNGFFNTFRENARDDMSRLLMTHAPGLASNETSSVPSGALQMWSWGGHDNRPVPETWKFPRGSVQAIMDLIVFGHPHHHIRPLRKIQCSSLRRADQQYFTKAMKIFKLLVEGAITLGVIADANAINLLSISEWDALFKVVFNKMVVKLGLHKKAGVLSVNTLYNKLSSTPHIDWE